MLCIDRTVNSFLVLHLLYLVNVKYLVVRSKVFPQLEELIDFSLARLGCHNSTTIETV
jgi:hypothetical protein